MHAALAKALRGKAPQKADALAGEEDYWAIFKEADTAAVRYYKVGPWYHNADIWSGLPTQQQTTSLQAFWPGAAAIPYLALEKRTGEVSAPPGTAQKQLATLLLRHMPGG